MRPRALLDDFEADLLTARDGGSKRLRRLGREGVQ